MRKLAILALVFFSSILVIAFSAQAQIRTDTLGGSVPANNLVGENIIKSDKVLQAAERAEKEGNVLVVYSDDSSFGGGHEDILSLGIGTNKETGERGVIVTGQFGLIPAIYTSGKTREKWVEEHQRYDAFIDAHVVVSKEKLEQLSVYTTKCSMKQGKYLFSGSTCWSYAETTWNDWQKMAEPPEKRTSICKEVNESYSGACTGLKFVCSSIHCQASRPTYVECLKKNHDAINSCMHNNTYCIDSHIKSKEDCVSNMIEPVHERFKKKDAVPAATPEIAKTPEPPRPKGSSRSAADVAAACKEFNSFSTGGSEGLAKVEAGAPPEQAAFYRSLMGFSEKNCDCLGDQLVNKQLGTAEEIDQIINMWNTKSWDARGVTMIMSGGVGRAWAACIGVLKADIQKMGDDARRMIDSMPK